MRKPRLKWDYEKKIWRVVKHDARDWCELLTVVEIAYKHVHYSHPMRALTIMVRAKHAHSDPEYFRNTLKEMTKDKP